MLGEQIKKVRNAKGLTQSELARRIGVSKQSVSNWENNNIYPSIKILRVLAEYLECSADYLLELNTDKLLVDTTKLTEKQVESILDSVRKFEKANARLGK